MVPKNGDPERQEKAHAHMCLLSSNGTLLVPDLVVTSSGA